MTTRGIPGLTFAALLVCIVSGCRRDVGPRYTVDLLGPNLVYEGNYTKVPDEVDVYVTAPHMGFRTGVGLQDLLPFTPVYRTKDSHEIKQLLADLSNERTDTRLSDTGVRGRTCHIVMLSTNTMRGMIFRVFLPEGGIGSSVLIYPKSDVGFGYENSRLVPWLRRIGISRLRVARSN